MKKTLLLLFIPVITAMSGFAQSGMGMIEKPGMMENFVKKVPDPKGYGGTLPASFSMMSYTPYVKSQGQYGTCASWAAAYSAFTTAWAYDMGMSDRNLITALSFCPYYVYNKANGDATCTSGNALEDVLLFMMDYGSKRFYMPVIGCGTGITTQMDNDAIPYKINDAFILYSIDNFPFERTAEAVNQFLFNKAKPDITAIKSAVADGNPVVFGGFVANSFMNALGVAHWEPTYEERTNPGKAVMDNTGMHQLHAMTIVGYDDNKFGGAFLIMNSWSNLWGENGYTWVSYDDWSLFNYKAFWLDIPTFFLESLSTSGCASGDCNNGYGVMKWTNGERYEGHFTNGMRNGYGIYTWPSGAAYAGQWMNDKRHGEGIVYNPDGSYGTCQYKDDTQVGGFGSWTYNNGDKYFGNLTADYQRNGYGIYKFTDGRKYEGAHTDGVFTGLGKMQWANGDSYVGEWSDNTMHGYGIYRFANGQMQAGNWNYGKLKTGQSYGYAKPGDKKMDRSGELFRAIDFATADCITGDCLNGKGSKRYSSGIVYEGEFKDALEDGYGIYTYPNGAKQAGYFIQGTPAGVFKITYPDGSFMIGENKGGKMDGNGIYVTTSGNVVMEYYSNGSLIREVSPTGTIMNMQMTPDSFGENPRTDMQVSNSK